MTAAAAAANAEDRERLSPFGQLVPTLVRGYSTARLVEQAGAVLTGPEPELAARPLRAGLHLNWVRALSALRAAMYHAVSPATPAGHRDALLGFLQACAGSGLLAAGGRLRLLTMFPEDGQPPAAEGAVIRVGQRRLLVLSLHVRGDGRPGTEGQTYALDYAPDGMFGAVPGFRLGEQTVFDPEGVTREMITSFVALARQRGPVPWRPGLPAALSSAAGISLAEATVILAGLPDYRNWPDSTDWRGTVSDHALGCAGAAWHWQLPRVRARALGSLLPADPAALWEAGPQADQLAAWLTEHRGARTAVADDLIVRAAAAQIATEMPASELLHGFASPGTCQWLTGRADTRKDNLVALLEIRRYAHEENMRVLQSVVKSLPWLAGVLAGDHPIRRELPKVLELTRLRLADPDFVIQISSYVREHHIDALARALGGPAIRDEQGITVGPVLFRPWVTEHHWYSALLRPALLAGLDDPVLGVLSHRLPEFWDHQVVLMRVLLSEHMTTWATYQVPEEAIGAEHDPSRAAPGLVREVADRHGVGEDAAALYLQILALPDPTDRNVADWTGWKPARLKAARAELAGTSLVVEGKRARAGRSLFLPGGWIARRPPLPPPIETWKQPLTIGGIVDVITIAPAPLLFEIAWQRVRDSDGPRFDDLVLEKKR